MICELFCVMLVKISYAKGNPVSSLESGFPTIISHHVSELSVTDLVSCLGEQPVFFVLTNCPV